MADESKVQKGVSKTESGILAQLWKNILTETGFENSLEYLINNYSKNSNSIKIVRKQTKSSLIKNIHAREMTWKTFINLLFDFLKVVRIDVSIKLHYANGEPTVHSVSVTNDRIKGKKDDK